MLSTKRDDLWLMTSRLVLANGKILIYPGNRLHYYGITLWYQTIILHITTEVVSLNPVHGEVYSKQHNVWMFVSDFWQLDDFLWLPPPIKLTATIYNWNIIESGIKHHYPNQTNNKILTCLFFTLHSCVCCSILAISSLYRSNDSIIFSA